MAAMTKKDEQRLIMIVVVLIGICMFAIHALNSPKKLKSNHPVLNTEDLGGNKTIYKP